MTEMYIQVSGQTFDSSTQKPNKRTFREAWYLDGEVITVDMANARDIHRDRLREMRDPMLVSLDADFMKALEQGQDTYAIATEKQKLRDVTADPRIEAAMTPDDLEDLTLTELLK